MLHECLQFEKSPEEMQTLKITNKHKAMPRKGITNNPKGRPKGSPNKITQDLRCWLSKLIDNNQDQIQRGLATLHSKSSCRAGDQKYDSKSPDYF